MQSGGGVEPGDGLRVGIARNARREVRQIGAERRDGVDFEREDPAGLIEGHARLGMVVARLRIRHQRLGPGRGPLDRALQQHRGPDHGRDLDREMGFQPEPAADIRRDHPELVLGHEERVFGEPAPQIMGRLAGRPQRDVPSRAVAFGEIGAGLQRGSGDAVGVERHRDHVMRPGEGRRRRLAVAALDLEDQVGAELLVQDRRVGIEAARDGGDRRQGIVVDRDRLGAVDRAVAVLGDHGGDHVADMVDLAGGERRAQHFVHRPSVGERHRVDAGQRPEPSRLPVGGGEHPEHPRQRRRRAIDAADAGMGVGRAHEGDMRRAGGLDIVDEPTAPLEELVVLAAPQPLSDIHFRVPYSPGSITGRAEPGVKPPLAAAAAMRYRGRQRERNADERIVDHPGFHGPRRRRHLHLRRNRVAARGKTPDHGPVAALPLTPTARTGSRAPSIWAGHRRCRAPARRRRCGSGA